MTSMDTCFQTLWLLVCAVFALGSSLQNWATQSSVTLIHSTTVSEELAGCIFWAAVKPLVPTCSAVTWCHRTENHNLKLYCHDNFKSYIVGLVLEWYRISYRRRLTPWLYQSRNCFRWNASFFVASVWKLTGPEKAHFVGGGFPWQ
jgi:hypothetical protein